jgi:DNA-binding MarR family transcriptional regulator
LTEEKKETSRDLDTIDLWHIFSRVFRNGKKLIERELEKIGIKPTELRVLFSLSKDHDTTMNSLATENDVTGPWITGVVDELEKKGYVTKVRSATDRRIIKVSITEYGNEALEQGIKVYNKLIELVLRNLSPEESAEFRSILSKIEIALSDQADR